MLCASACAPTGTSVAPVCPPMEAYEPAMQEQAAAEIEAGQAPALARLAGDYLTMRDRLRRIGCSEQTPPGSP